MSIKYIPIILIIGIITSGIFQVYGQDKSSINSEDLVEAKRTSLELYLTAAQAYEMWNTDKANVKVLDVRTLEEYIFVGHAPMATNIALAKQTHDWDDEMGMFALKPNPDFIDRVKTWAAKDDIILVMCRSGGRSAMAINLMAKAGFTHVYNIIDGFEGDKVKDPESVYDGKRLRNGWKNSNIPWTYKIDPEQVKISAK